ncbi:unnamed protein product [Didymodactylos carnosus]|uniref:Uncharacterized protein n=1 Tax=Didymodactylos carnosus TaxID=1234261 RepID=A0A814QIN2_9BILA|nr:unnamed protein product [Didymodactylos carnosus]CAF3883702.1 unnamed protein product [Didymodactylos carnosus]
MIAAASWDATYANIGNRFISDTIEKVLVQIRDLVDNDQTAHWRTVIVPIVERVLAFSPSIDQDLLVAKVSNRIHLDYAEMDIEQRLHDIHAQFSNQIQEILHEPGFMNMHPEYKMALIQGALHRIINERFREIPADVLINKAVNDARLTTLPVLGTGEWPSTWNVPNSQTLLTRSQATSDLEQDWKQGQLSEKSFNDGQTAVVGFGIEKAAFMDQEKATGMSNVNELTKAERARIKPNLASNYICQKYNPYHGYKEYVKQIEAS